MKRVRVLREGMPSVDARYIRLNAIRWDNEPMPVYATERGGPVGIVRTLRRERDGWITAVPFDFKVTRGFALAAKIVVDDDGVIENDSFYKSIVTSGKLEGLFVTDTPAWPGMKIR